ncbi:substrate-binding domain-containing protein [Aquabacterium sp. A7-Y]|uniref:substrate-binding domain-containing protein n=1 Tax=Aquabacterium sp. A7-Y TaxID=1349605 RepID=UPI00223E25FE|nr:substrate-binding domain-containing protein [Aquabacterium sp. A7-Y]MCW7539130.1 substrate-binding domain-containing protein [Aquabacterium sp. A7-Y]
MPLICTGHQLATPPLTTVRQPLFERGQAAATALLSLIEGVPAALVAPAPRLVVRETTRRL